MIVGAVTELLVWTGAGLGALGGVVLLAGTVAVMLLGRDDDAVGSDGSLARPDPARNDGQADLAAAA